MKKNDFAIFQAIQRLCGNKCDRLFGADLFIGAASNNSGNINVSFVAGKIPYLFLFNHKK